MSSCQPGREAYRARRIESLRNHFLPSAASSTAGSSVAQNSLDRHRDGVSAMSQPSADAVLSNIKNAEDVYAKGSALEKNCTGDYDFINLIPGPLQDVGPGRHYGGITDIMWELADAAQRGCNHLVWESYTKKYGAEGMSSNIVIPMPVFGRDEVTGKSRKPIISRQVLINNPKDCERIARKHTAKQPNFTSFLFGSVLSTTDEDNWRHQRSSFNMAFLPAASLAKVLPISLTRAEHCADRLFALSKSGRCSVNMNEFFLHETQAQLQLGMFGESEEFMDETNVQIRRKLAGEMTGDLVPLLKQVLKNAEDQSRLSPDGDRPGSINKPVKGPLAARLRETEDLRFKPGDKGEVQELTKLGNALIFEFAGHDTTGHTLTFLTFELARNPEVQKRLQAEVDSFWAKRESEAGVGAAFPYPIKYQDFVELPYLTCCVTETLRLWGVVPQGTFRQLISDDVVHVGDKRVKLRAGTSVQILNWNRHRNPDLWGADVLEWNPDREFEEKELWFHAGFAAYNPHTDRFSPFTHPPRDCIGKNFAQMEIRTILLHLLRRFSFQLAAPYDQWVKENDNETITATLGVNMGTMGPRDLREPALVKFFDGYEKPPYGLHCNIKAR